MFCGHVASGLARLQQRKFRKQVVLNALSKNEASEDEPVALSAGKSALGRNQWSKQVSARARLVQRIYKRRFGDDFWLDDICGEDDASQMAEVAGGDSELGKWVCFTSFLHAMAEGLTVGHFLPPRSQ